MLNEFADATGVYAERMARIAYIGVGSNLDSPAGAPGETLAAAAEALASVGAVVASSSLYRTAPVGYEEQPRFANAVIALRTDQDPEKLLDSLMAIEQSLGRNRAAGIAKGPRTLDLDLLMLDDLIYESPRLVVPHPELAQRRFVLAPLEEIAPEAVHPVLKRTVRELLDELPDEGPNRKNAVQRLGRIGTGRI
jgi:2-amino-4-hydroxy-6-hydroxymethyldihydropteridine diphosphokinase